MTLCHKNKICDAETELVSEAQLNGASLDRLIMYVCYLASYLNQTSAYLNLEKTWFSKHFSDCHFFLLKRIKRRSPYNCLITHRWYLKKCEGDIMNMI